MKKILQIGSVVALLAAMSSCKKDRVCGCVGTSTEPGTDRTITYVTFTHAKLSDAKKACVKQKREYQSGGQTYVNTTDCALKD